MNISKKAEQAKHEGLHGDPKKAMSMLARAFPALEKAVGVEPFDAKRLAEWTNGRSHGERCSAQFILSVWNPDDLRQGVFGLPNFDLQEALRVWNEEHKAAFHSWVCSPWWP